MIDELGMYERIRKADMHVPVALSRHWTFTDIVRVIRRRTNRWPFDACSIKNRRRSARIRVEPLRVAI